MIELLFFYRLTLQHFNAVYKQMACRSNFYPTGAAININRSKQTSNGFKKNHTFGYVKTTIST